MDVDTQPIAMPEPGVSALLTSSVNAPQEADPGFDGEEGLLSGTNTPGKGDSNGPMEHPISPATSMPQPDSQLVAIKVAELAADRPQGYLEPVEVRHHAKPDLKIHPAYTHPQ